MSYIKSAIVFDGIARIVEVHGATWCYLDVQAYGKGGARQYRELAAKARGEGSDPAFYERIAAGFEQVAQKPYSINSELAHEILDRGLSPVTDANSRAWVKFALEEDIPGTADHSERPPAVLVDFDVRRLADTPDNFYAEYQRYLPDGWTYERDEPGRMVETLFPRLPESDRPRLGSIEGV